MLRKPILYFYIFAVSDYLTWKNIWAVKNILHVKKYLKSEKDRGEKEECNLW